MNFYVFNGDNSLGFYVLSKNNRNTEGYKKPIKLPKCG
jgi:hypothetical protein